MTRSLNRRRLVLIGSLIIVVYVATFASTVQQGHVMYGLLGDGTNRGSFRFYWFSTEHSRNNAAGTIFFPILRWGLNSRRYSSFNNDADCIEWCESGNDVFMDDVTQLK
jgi:hypothetical protein